METPEPPVQLMYRRPAEVRGDRPEEYEKLTDVMDDILIRLAQIEEKLNKLG